MGADITVCNLIGRSGCFLLTNICKLLSKEFDYVFFAFRCDIHLFICLRLNAPKL